MNLYIHSSIRLHGVVHNYLSTETTLRFSVWHDIYEDSISTFAWRYRGNQGKYRNYVQEGEL
jgi:hypothetical protein